MTRRKGGRAAQGRCACDGKRTAGGGEVDPILKNGPSEAGDPDIVGGGQRAADVGAPVRGDGDSGKIACLALIGLQRSPHGDIDAPVDGWSADEAHTSGIDARGKHDAAIGRAGAGGDDVAVDAEKCVVDRRLSSDSQGHVAAANVSRIDAAARECRSARYADRDRASRCRRHSDVSADDQGNVAPRIDRCTCRIDLLTGNQCQPATGRDRSAGTDECAAGPGEICIAAVKEVRVGKVERTGN